MNLEFLSTNINPDVSAQEEVILVLFAHVCVADQGLRNRQICLLDSAVSHKQSMFCALPITYKAAATRSRARLMFSVELA